MTTNDATPRERITATWWEGGSDKESADATIRMLWSMADDPAVVEAVAKATWDAEPANARWDAVREIREWDLATDPMLNDARTAITATLTALIGPRPQENDDGQ